MAILSCRISSITTSRSVWPGRRSTSGRAPSISSIIRFWIRAVSLNRPPTLFTISSLFRASIIVQMLRCSYAGGTCALQRPGLLVPNDTQDLGHRAVEVVVNDHVVERPAALGHVDFP